MIKFTVIWKERIHANNGEYIPKGNTLRTYICPYKQNFNMKNY